MHRDSELFECYNYKNKETNGGTNEKETKNWTNEELFVFVNLATSILPTNLKRKNVL